MAQLFHKRIHLVTSPESGRKMYQPLSKSFIEGPVLGTRNLSCLFNKVFVSAQRYIFHTIIVYTKTVRGVTAMGGLLEPFLFLAQRLLQVLYQIIYML